MMLLYKVLAAVLVALALLTLVPAPASKLCLMEILPWGRAAKQ